MKNMGFNESLENNLKSLEAQEERDPVRVQEQRERAEQERKNRLAAAPFATKLRDGAFTQALLADATRIGFSKRVKVHIAWMDTTLRLEARNLRLELKPTVQGVVAHYSQDGQETDTAPLDLDGDAAVLAESWLARLQP